MKTRILGILLAILMVVSVFALTACDMEALQGPQGEQGEKGETGINGEDGKDGQNGKDGVGIASIQKLSTEGLVDTYLIIFTDGSTSTFTVTNGEVGEKGDKGDKGDQGEPGEKGDTGATGVGIEKVEYNADGNLVITYTDGTTQTIITPENQHTHTFGEWINHNELSSCEDQLYYRICSGCSDIEWREGSYDDHDFETVTTPPTCQAGGFDTKTCKNCGNSYTENHIIPLGHEFVNGICTRCDNSDPNYIVKYSEGLEFKSNGDGTCYVRGIGTCTDINIVIPKNSPDGDTVTSIGTRAFIECTNITSVVIPNSVTTIGNNSFYRCYNLASVTIPNSVTSIGISAFRDCKKLNNVKIPNSVTKIDDGAFSYCTSITCIVIPSSVTHIKNNAFDNCSALTSIIVEEGNDYYKIIDGNLYSMDGKNLIRYVALNDSIFEIPRSVTSIYSGSFGGCKGLTEIVIHDGVISINENAFKNCPDLMNITVDENNKYYTSINGNLYSKDGKTLIQYAIGKSDTTFEIPNNVTSIGKYAFMWCSNITTIIIPNNITSINAYTFGYCSNLTKVYISSSVTSIDNFAFEYCTSLTEIIIPDSVTTIGRNVFYGCINLTNIIIPDGITSVSISLFLDCTNLTSVVIPDSVTSIGNYAFSNCSSLTDVYYTGTEEEWAAITVGSYNEELENATIHYNYVPEE